MSTVAALYFRTCPEEEPGHFCCILARQKLGIPHKDTRCSWHELGLEVILCSIPKTTMFNLVQKMFLLNQRGN